MADRKYRWMFRGDRLLRVTLVSAKGPNRTAIVTNRGGSVLNVPRRSLYGSPLAAVKSRAQRPGFVVVNGRIWKASVARFGDGLRAIAKDGAPSCGVAAFSRREAVQIARTDLMRHVRSTTRQLRIYQKYAKREERNLNKLRQKFGRIR